MFLSNIFHNNLNPKLAKWGVIGSIIAILILTVLEFPAPVGFETRPQTNVSIIWLLLFVTILISEIAAISLIFKHPELGVKFAYVAAGLNIFQIFADQLHLMQPEVAPIGYTLLELSVGTIALILIYFALNVSKNKNL